MTITQADILAAVDVLREAAAEADDIDFEQAVALRSACTESIAAARQAIAALEVAMLEQVESAPKQVGRVTYIAIDDRTTRFDHDDIARQVVAVAKERATDPETGEVVTSRAVAEAVDLMRMAYVAPSSKAKQTALTYMGLDPDDVTERTKKGRKLHEVDAEAL